MSAPSQEPKQPLTAAHLDAWVRTATTRRLEIHLHAVEPSANARGHAFWEMAKLCKDAIEEVRVMSAQLREESQAARGRSAELLADSARLLVQYAAPESQLLQIFKGEKRTN